MTGCKAIWIPSYQRGSVRKITTAHNAEVKYYHTDKDWNPVDLYPADDEAVLLVNYYGIIPYERMMALTKLTKHLIVGNCQTFFCPLIEEALDMYLCRKFMGMSDGAYMAGKDARMSMEECPQGYSSDTVVFSLLCIEYGYEGKSYQVCSVNEERIDNELVMKMSKLIHSIFDRIDYSKVRHMRRENFSYMHKQLCSINLINPLKYLDGETVPIVYPFVIENDEIIEWSSAVRHFQGHWWGHVPYEHPTGSFEYWIADNITPLTIGQRYGGKEMNFIIFIVRNQKNNYAQIVSLMSL